MNDVYLRHCGAFGSARAVRCPVFLSSASLQQQLHVVPQFVGGLVKL